MDIRKEINNILNEVFGEAVATIHFDDRIEQRLSSSQYTRPRFDYPSVERQIELIKNINFNPEYSYAIKIKQFPNTFVSIDPETGSKSVGDELWTVIRGNLFTTIFFRNSHQTFDVKDTDYKIDFKQLVSLYQSSQKNEDGTVDFEQKTTQPRQHGSGRKKVDLDFPMVNLDGSLWYIDEKNEEIIFSKNIKKKISFEELKDEVLEKVIDSI